MEKVILILRCIFFAFILSLMTIQAWAKDFIPAKGTELDSIQWEPAEMKARFAPYFSALLNKEYDPLAFKIQIDLIGKELFNAGYFRSEVSNEGRIVNGDFVETIKIELNERINFNFSGNYLLSYQELRNHLIEKIKNDFGQIDEVYLLSSINEAYEEIGFFNSQISFYRSTGKNSDKGQVINLHFKIVEGKKIGLQEIVFRGNSYVSSREVQDILREARTSLVAGGFYDRKFFEEFRDVLLREYLKRGFVMAEVSRPRIAFNQANNTALVEYGIVEKQQVTLKEINLSKIEPGLQERLRPLLTNKEGSPLNVVALEGDLRKIVEFFQNEGYYFATIPNLNDDNLLVYDRSLSNATLRPDIALDRKICFNEAIINGLVKTKAIVLQREIHLKQGELITPAKLEGVRQRLSGLNLFSNLNITPYIMYEAENKDCPRTNLVIQTKEKDFGLLEIAPGFRTDLGAKLSTGISYNNMGGMNRSASLRLQANRRFNLTGFDERRRIDDKDLLEYSARASVGEPYLFYNLLKTQVEFELSASFQRNRYYGFDADIFRISPQFSKNFTKWFSTSVRYQFERIDQFDATELKDNDNFSIGGITPTLTFDFRDDVINPRKGAFFSLSSEWANSNFGSMRENDLEVNFIKVISRNRFYYPIGDFTLAISLAMGYQKNFADEILRDANGNPLINVNGNPRTRGYIPSIKVFRLDGYDEIRGYDESEINRLISGTPVGEVIVQNEAYFTAIKVEPRYDITDNMRVGVFFDAGRVFVDDFKPTKLRTSVGAGLKFITPVGSLDFDYGFKLHRKEKGGSEKESVGRFHLSIGYF